MQRGVAPLPPPGTGCSCTSRAYVLFTKKPAGPLDDDSCERVFEPVHKTFRFGKTLASIWSCRPRIAIKAMFFLNRSVWPCLFFFEPAWRSLRGCILYGNDVLQGVQTLSVFFETVLPTPERAHDNRSVFMKRQYFADPRPQRLII